MKKSKGRAPVRTGIAVVLLAFGHLWTTTALAQGGWQRLDVTSRTIGAFEIGSRETQFGPLTFVGGLEMTSAGGALGGMSAIRFEPGGQGFVGVMDTGHFFAGRVERDDAGRLSGMQAFAIAPIMLSDGSRGPDKGSVDAEGMAIGKDRVLVSFERDHRIGVFDRSGWPTGNEIDTLDFLIPPQELRSNQGLETVTIAPEDSPLQGAVVTVGERSLNPEGDIFAAIVSGRERGVFFVRRHAPFDVTDGTFLPDGDLLLLERRFSILGGVGMRIRRIDADIVAPGETVDGEVLLEADFGYQIDNMEGIDAVTMDDGTTSIFLVSDDNHSLLQRNLVLEFRLNE